MTKQRSLCRRVAYIVSILVCAIAGCGSTPVQVNPLPGGPAPTVTVPIPLPITLSLAGNFSRERLAALDDLIARYEALNADVKIEVVRAPKDSTRRREWVADRLNEGDTSLDILLLDATWPAELGAGGSLVPLEEEIESLGIELSTYLPGTIQANELQGHLVALPWVADAGLLYYRRDLLEAHGYGPPSTWAGLQQIALEIREREGLPDGYVWQGTADENLTCNTLEQVWGHGGDVFDGDGNIVFDSPQTYSALEQMRNLVASGASPQDVANYDDVSSLASFRNGEAAFMRHWSTAWEYVNSEDSPVAGRVGIAALPRSRGFGQSLALSSYSLHPDQALRFMAFLAGDEQQGHMALAANQPPVLAAAYEDTALLGHAPLLEILGTAFANAKPRPSLAEYALLSEAIYTEANSMLAGNQGAETTAINIQRRIESMLR